MKKKGLQERKKDCSDDFPEKRTLDSLAVGRRSSSKRVEGKVRATKTNGCDEFVSIGTENNLEEGHGPRLENQGEEEKEGAAPKTPAYQRKPSPTRQKKGKKRKRSCAIQEKRMGVKKDGRKSLKELEDKKREGSISSTICIAGEGKAHPFPFSRAEKKQGAGVRRKRLMQKRTVSFSLREGLLA